MRLYRLSAIAALPAVLAVGSSALAVDSGSADATGAEVAADYMPTIFVPGEIQPRTAIITTLVDPPGAGTASGGGEYALNGQYVTMTAVANRGWVFTKWTDAGTTMWDLPDYSFELSVSRELVAHFEPISLEPRIPLGSAERFTVVTGSYSNQSSADGFVLGNMAVSPGVIPAGTIPPFLLGELFSGDAISAQAHADVAAAWDNGYARRPDAKPWPTNYYQKMFAPGVYEMPLWATFDTTSFTFNAYGNPGAVFVIIVPFGLDATGRQMNLAGGAQASDIYWIVYGGGRIYENATVLGTIIATDSVLVDAQATIKGRVLLRDGSLTMNGGLVEVPVPVPSYWMIR